MAKHTDVMIPATGWDGGDGGDPARSASGGCRRVRMGGAFEGAAALEQGHDNVLPQRTVAAIRPTRWRFKGVYHTGRGRDSHQSTFNSQAAHLYARCGP